MLNPQIMLNPNEKDRLVSCTITNFLTRPFTWTFYGMELNRKRNLRIEIYKTSNIVKFEFMKEIFSFRQSNKAI